MAYTGESASMALQQMSNCKVQAKTAAPCQGRQNAAPHVMQDRFGSATTSMLPDSQEYICSVAAVCYARCQLNKRTSAVT